MRLPLARITVFLLCTFFSSSTPAQQQTDNLLTFSRLYGYVKYFHPSDEAASIDWDRFAAYGCRQVEHAANPEELQQTLTTLFKPVAPTVQIFPEGEKPSFNKSALLPPDLAGYKTIAWQHLGVGFGNPNNIYESARTNRPILKDQPSAGFVSLSSFLDARSLQGKEFIFRGRVSMTDGNGSGHLWVRVDKTNKEMGFFNNMGDRPIHQKEWAMYEIKGTVDSSAAVLIFGIFLQGKGELWFDDFSLQIREQDGWKEVYKNTFEKDTPGQSPKSLYANNTTSAGYTMAVQKSTDPVQQYVSIKSKEQTATVQHTTLFKQYPQVGEWVEKKIGNGLTAVIPLAVYGTKEHTYPAADKEGLNKLKQALQDLPAAEMTGNNLYTRLGDLVVAWNVFQHFFPYFDVAKTDWNEDLKTAVKRAYADKTADDFHKTLQQLTARLKDGHVRVNTGFNKATFLPPLHWEWIEQELVITSVNDEAIPLQKGDIVKQINGQSAKDYFNGIYPYISAATPGWLQGRAQMESLTGEQGTAMNLVIERPGTPATEVTVKRTATLSNFYASRFKKDTIKQLAPDVMYINLDLAPMDRIEKAMPELKKSKAIICDLRGYPNNNHKLLEYLLPGNDTSGQWMQVPQIIYPDQEAITGYQKMGWHLKPGKPHLDAKMFFLIDGQAISYAESYMGFVEHYKLATIIGQPTAGTNGNVNSFVLNGDYHISFTGMKVLKHNGSQHHGIGIIPNIPVSKTIRGVREGRDEFLEKALEVAKEAISRETR